MMQPTSYFGEMQVRKGVTNQLKMKVRACQGRPGGGGDKIHIGQRGSAQSVMGSRGSTSGWDVRGETGIAIGFGLLGGQ